MNVLGLLAQSSALPPPPAPGAGHSVSALSIVLVVLVVLGSAAMVSLSSRRFKRRSTESPAASPAPDTGMSPTSSQKPGDAAERLNPDLLSRLHRVTEAPVERRRLGDRRPKAASEVDAEAENASEAAVVLAPDEPIGPAPSVMLSDDEPKFPEPIPIHRRTNRAGMSEATGRGRAWPGSSLRATMPGLSDDELRVLEGSRSEQRAGTDGKMRRRPTTRGVASLEDDLALANELSGVVRELLFCANSGQLLHGFALYSDAFLFRTMDDSGLSEAEFKATFQQVAAKPIRDWTRLAEIRDIESHADNVVTATIVYTPPASATEAPRERFRFLKNDESGAWMIDDIEPMD